MINVKMLLTYQYRHFNLSIDFKSNVNVITYSDIFTTTMLLVGHRKGENSTVPTISLSHFNCEVSVPYAHA